MRTHLLRAGWCAGCGSSSDPGVSSPSFLLASWGFSCSVWSYILLSIAPALIHSTFFHFICLISHIFSVSSSSERLACISFTWNSLHPSPQNIISWQFLCPVLSCLHTAVLFKTASLFISISASNPRSQTFPTPLFPRALAVHGVPSCCWCTEMLAISSHIFPTLSEALVSHCRK